MRPAFLSKLNNLLQKLSSREKILISTACGLIILLILNTLVLQPILDYNQHLTAKIQQDSKLLNDMLKNNGIKTQRLQLYPGKDSDCLALILKIINATGLKRIRLSQENSSPDSLSVRFELKGSSENIMKFIQSIERSEFIVSFEEAEMAWAEGIYTFSGRINVPKETGRH